VTTRHRQRLISKPQTGAGSAAGQDNPACKNAESFPAEQTETPRSPARSFFGTIKILDLVDLTRDKECTDVPIDNWQVDLYIVSHHGCS